VAGSSAQNWGSALKLPPASVPQRLSPSELLYTFVHENVIGPEQVVLARIELLTDPPLIELATSVQFVIVAEPPKIQLLILLPEQTMSLSNKLHRDIEPLYKTDPPPMTS